MILDINGTVIIIVGLTGKVFIIYILKYLRLPCNLFVDV